MALILLALVTLVVVPLLVRLHTSRIERHRDQVAQPARDLVNTIQLSLAREMGALRGFVITEDEAFLSRYEEALAAERDAYRSLAPLVGSLGPDVAADFDELRSHASRWHGRVTEAEILTRQLVPEAFIERIRSEEVLYEQALNAAERLRGRIVDEVERNRDEILRVEGLSFFITVFLVLLAFAASLGALWLGRRLRRVARDAERRRAEVERVSENRSRLIRGITHDVKNPLGAARGHLQLLLSGIVTEPERVRRGIERSDRAIGAAAEIIDDLLALARADEGRLPLSPVRSDLTALVRETAEDQRPEAARAGIALEVEIRDPVVPVITDPRRVREIVRNLISNALKYTPEGGAVTVRLREAGNARAGRGDRRWLAIDVIDTGEGIPPGDRERIFHEFLRLEPGDDRIGGSGLGLAISRRIARLLGGDIEVESEVGVGSAFSLWLPPDPGGTSS